MNGQCRDGSLRLKRGLGGAVGGITGESPPRVALVAGRLVRKEVKRGRVSFGIVRSEV
jgi:hypothetical protein